MHNQDSNEMLDSAVAGAIELEVAVKNRLNSQVRDFQVIASGGGLILRGKSRTFYAKQMAQHSIMEATSVRILANEIEVASRSNHDDGSQ